MAEKKAGSYRCSECGFNEVVNPKDICLTCLGKKQLKEAGEFRINVMEKFFSAEQPMEVN